MRDAMANEKTNAKLVWTSDPETARKLRESGAAEPRRDAAPAAQTIRVAVDRKRRAGKTVTVATGFEQTAEGLAKLATQLKKRCGSGGTAKDAEIEIQGDHVQTIAAELARLGYRVKT
jgi:translation initiation factor 1